MALHYQEAIDVLTVLDRSVHPDGSNYPMIYYYLAYFQARLGDPDKSDSYAKLAATLPVDYCFPYRQESLEALEYILSFHPEDARARYYLGNLLFDHQPQKAVNYWESALELDDSNPYLFRNLGLSPVAFMIPLDLPSSSNPLEKSKRNRS